MQSIPYYYFTALLCVFGISAGQILFKLSASRFNEIGSWYDQIGLGILTAALILYGATTLGWIWVLQKLELGRVYPLMALAFVLVPIGCHFFFGERFQFQYYIGVFLIISGIFIILNYS